jgi:ribosomal protein S14
MIEYDTEIVCRQCGVAHPSSVEYRRRSDGSMSRLCRECWRENAYQTREATDD